MKATGRRNWRRRCSVSSSTPPRHEQAPLPASAPPRVVSAGHTIERVAAAREVLKTGEYAITTYVLAATDAMLLAPAVIATGTRVGRPPPSSGQGSALYGLGGGVLLSNG